MSTPAQWVFDRAIELMDEQNEKTGATRTPDTKEYALRSVGLLNVLRQEALPFSSDYRVPADGGRPSCSELSALTDSMPLEDAISQGALPYGLASRLLLGEDNVLADFFEQKFQERLAALGRTAPAQWEDIPLHYGF